MTLSRREFAAFAALGGAVKGFGQSVPFTAGQIVERIKAHLGAEVRPIRLNPAARIRP